MALGLYSFVDEQDLAVLADVERDPCREFLVALDQTVGFGRGQFGIAEDRVIKREGFRKFLVGVGVIATCSKVRDVELPNFFATLTERLAFGSSTTSKRLWIPGDHDGLLALEIGKRVGLAIASLQGKFGRVIASRQIGAGVGNRSGHPEQEANGEQCFFHDCWFVFLSTNSGIGAVLHGYHTR